MERGQLIVFLPQGGQSSRQPRRCAARRVWRILTGSEQRTSKGVRVRGPERRRCESALRCSHDGSNVEVHLLLRGRDERLKTSVAMNPSPPWPARGSPAERLDRERRGSGGGTERSTLTRDLGRAMTRAAGCERQSSQTGMPAHRVRDASTAGAIPWSKDLEGDQSPGRVGRTAAGNGGHRYGPIGGATPRR